ncbi:APC family permease [Lacticaseibacillus yichunensis]|uniref:APC family permease n=1 Tax=Lacticaseibacillus yichunensis TaxID=2486015 RepID=A0ABW4CSU9_9LACO|nr:APC family permease [Lacticaseibacillus yichunensis]
MQRAAKRHATGRTLSFGSVLLLGINGIIGSGIFLLPGTLYQQSGKWSVLALIAAGLVTTMIALCYAAMASKIDDDGGAWVYADRAFGRFLGFQTGWFGWFLGVITIAAEITAFLTTLGGLVPAVKTRPVYLAVALGILALLAILNLVGSSLLTFIDNLSSVLKIGIIVVFVGAAGFFISRHSFELPSAGSNGGGFSQSFAATFYMYTGFSFLPVAAKKMANPEKTLPRALLIVMAIVMVVYTLTDLATMAILGGALSGNALPVANAFAAVVGTWGKIVVLLGMLVSILGVAIAVSFDTPVEMASLATEKELLPAIFGRTNKSGTPIIAVLVTIGLAALLILSGSYLFLVNLIVLAAFLQYITTIFSWFKLRHDPTLPAGMKMPGGMLFPIIGLLVILYLMTSLAWTTWLIAVGMAAVGTIVYATDDRRNKPKKKIAG